MQVLILKINNKMERGRERAGEEWLWFVKNQGLMAVRVVGASRSTMLKVVRKGKEKK